MKRPAFSFEAEILTDAPFEYIEGRLRDEGPQAFKSLRVVRVWSPLEQEEGRLVLRWARVIASAEESGEFTLSPDPKGAHLQLRGRMRGWAGFLLFGMLRWRADRLLDRFVEEL